MGVHIETLEDIDDLTITHREATEVLRIAEEAGWRTDRALELWANGEELSGIVRQTIKGLYFQWQKRVLYGYVFPKESTQEVHLDMFAAVGIEPPEPVNVKLGHGG